MDCLAHIVGTQKQCGVLHNLVCFPICLGFQEVQTLEAPVVQAEGQLGGKSSVQEAGQELILKGGMRSSMWRGGGTAFQAQLKVGDMVSREPEVCGMRTWAGPSLMLTAAAYADPMTEMSLEE